MNQLVPVKIPYFDNPRDLVPKYIEFDIMSASFIQHMTNLVGGNLPDTLNAKILHAQQTQKFFFARLPIMKTDAFSIPGYTLEEATTIYEFEGYKFRAEGLFFVPDRYINGQLQIPGIGFIVSSKIDLTCKQVLDMKMEPLHGNGPHLYLIPYSQGNNFMRKNV